HTRVLSPSLTRLGGQERLVFAGASFVTDATGKVVACVPAFTERVVVVDIAPGPERRVTLPGTPVGPWVAPGERVDVGVCEPVSREAEVWQAVVLGTRDYVEKNGFPGVVLGLSGGVDSS